MGLRRIAIAAVASSVLALAGCASAMVPEMTSRVTYQTANTSGQDVRLAVHEEGAGKPLVLLHGLGASSYTWTRIMPELARKYRVITIDLKGFGGSDKPLDGKYSIFEQARLVENVIRERDLKGVTLIGHSYGGAVALAVALSQLDKRGGRVERLVLIDAVAYRQPMPFFFQILRTPVIGEIGFTLVPPEVQAEHAMNVAYYNHRKVPGDAVRQYAEPLRTEGGRHALYQTITNLEPANADAIATRYRELKLPSLVLWCDHDRIVPMKSGERLAEDLPNARLEIIHRCGHIPHEEQPTDTAAAILRFLGRRQPLETSALQ